MNEARIIINGVELTLGQSMTLRVALQSFAMDLKENGLGSDEMGKSIAKGYLARISEMNNLIMRDENERRTNN